MERVINKISMKLSIIITSPPYSLNQNDGNEKRILFFLNSSDSINIKFILDEKAFQGLSIGILFFGFCKVVKKLLKKKNLKFGL